jgi:hypothetical protein
MSGPKIIDTINSRLLLMSARIWLGANIIGLAASFATNLLAGVTEELNFFLVIMYLAGFAVSSPMIFITWFLLMGLEKAKTITLARRIVTAVFGSLSAAGVIAVCWDPLWTTEIFSKDIHLLHFAAVYGGATFISTWIFTSKYPVNEKLNYGTD